MSGVDVLEVLDRAVRVLDLGKSHYTAACVTDARAAVAELIEVASDVLYELRDKSDAKNALIAALSRVRGAE